MPLTVSDLDTLVAYFTGVMDRCIELRQRAAGGDVVHRFTNATPVTEVQESSRSCEMAAKDDHGLQSERIVQAVRKLCARSAVDFSSAHFRHDVRLTRRPRTTAVVNSREKWL